MYADVTFNESLPYFPVMSISRDLGLYLPTRVPLVSPILSALVKTL